MTTTTTTTTTAPPEREGRSPLAVVLQFLSYGVLIAIALAMFVPFIYAVSTSFKSLNEASLPGIRWIPENFTIEAYQKLLQGGFGQATLNSVIVTFGVMAGRLVMNSMAGYALARIEFHGRNAIFSMIVASMFIPGIVLIVPRFLVLAQLGWLNSFQGMIVPIATDAFGIFLMKQFFESIPKEVEESAMMDGASRFTIFTQIILPLAGPALATMAILSFQSAWNELIHYLVVTGTNPPLYTLTLWLAQLRGTGFQVDWPVIMAGSMLTTIPTALLFLFFQRYFIEGVSHSGSKEG